MQKSSTKSSEIDVNAIPKDNLHEWMQKANNDNNMLDVFYLNLMSSDIFTLVLDTKEDSDPKDYLSLYHWQLENQIDAIAFFSSEEKARQALNQIIGESSQQLAINIVKISAKKLFIMTLEQTLVLNPNSDISKIFYADEIFHLLEETNTAIIKNKLIGPVRFFTVEQLPKALIEEAKSQLKDMRNIKKAFIVGFETSIEQSDKQIERGYLIAIELMTRHPEHSIDTIAQELGWKLIEVLNDAEILDIAEILPECQISQFIKQNVKPFYEFSAGSFLKDIPLHQ